MCSNGEGGGKFPLRVGATPPTPCFSFFLYFYFAFDFFLVIFFLVLMYVI